MKDRNGTEIQVGDTLQFESGVTATVMLTSALFARIKVCKSGTEESIGFLDRINFKIIKKVEVISKSNQKETIMTPAQEITTNTTKHKYADILIAIANGEQIEGKNEKDQWCVVDSNIVLYGIYSTGKVDLNIRVKPKTININGHEVPVALKVKPEYGTMYYCPSLSNKFKYDWETFRNDDYDNITINKGIMHLTAEAAQKHAEALLSFTKV